MKYSFLLAILLVIPFTSIKSEDYQSPRKLIIAGKVTNYDHAKDVIELSINQPGFNQESISIEIDSLGRFSTAFEIYRPTDAWLMYKTNFLVLIHPGDSIYVEFDGKPGDRPSILKSIEFSGDAAKSNRDAAVFQFRYFSDPLYWDWKKEERAIKEYDTDRYLVYLDSVRQERRKMYRKFISDIKPDNETKIWASTFVEFDYYNSLNYYPNNHRRANNLNKEQWKVPVSYFDALKKWSPMTEPMIISGYAMSCFTNIFRYGYSWTKIMEGDEIKKYETAPGVITTPSGVMDSLLFYGNIKYTSDPLLRQLVLTEMFSEDFKSGSISYYEKNRETIDNYITLPYLKNNLSAQYIQTKQRIENPKIYSESVLRKLENSSAKEILDSVIFSNKGKVVYIDCWATWCGPCRAEMHNSRILAKQMEGKDVSFVYLCLDSEEYNWKACLDEFRLKGQHYFLSKKQSADLRSALDVRGVPHYVILDKKGLIVEGSNLRPNEAKAKIEELIRQ
ncbi:MAG: TlpA disulfide reductase family protein [Bacteroidota bacterium]|nr:TlpA disulfide reductase family protein [Bacteroidota bacterium]